MNSNNTTTPESTTTKSTTKYLHINHGSGVYPIKKEFENTIIEDLINYCKSEKTDDDYKKIIDQLNYLDYYKGIISDEDDEKFIGDKIKSSFDMKINDGDTNSTYKFISSELNVDGKDITLIKSVPDDAIEYYGEYKHYGPGIEIGIPFTNISFFTIPFTSTVTKIYPTVLFAICENTKNIFRHGELTA